MFECIRLPRVPFSVQLLACRKERKEGKEREEGRERERKGGRERERELLVFINFKLFVTMQPPL